MKKQWKLFPDASITDIGDRMGLLSVRRHDPQGRLYFEQFFVLQNDFGEPIHPDVNSLTSTELQLIIELRESL